MVIVDKVLIALGIDPKGMQTGADESGKQIDRVEKKVDEAKKKLKSVGQSVDNFGKKAGHVLMGFVAPVLAAVSVGKMIGGYFSDLAAVAESTGAYNKTLEETRLKKAQLQRVTKDDIEFYKKSREALVKFNISLADFSAAVMHSIMPAMEKMLGWLDKLTSWVSRNPDNIIRFLKILGTVVGTVLIPVFVRWAAVLLANPITWIVGLVLALALAIDDLIVYLKGGRSSLDSLWKAMGFVKGDTAALAKMIAWLKDTGLSLAKALGVLLTGFTAFKAVTGIINGIRTAWTALSASFLANPVVLAFGLVATAAYMLYKRWDDVCEGAKALAEDIADFFTGWGRGIADGFSALADDIGDAWDSVTDFFAGLIADASSSLSDFGTLCSDKASAAGDAIGTAFSTALDAVGGVWQGMKDGAGALVDDIEGVFSGLTGWFSSLWDKITGIFDRAIGGIKSGIMSVTDALGITDSKTDSKREEREELAEHTPTDPEFERQRQAIIARRKKREQTQAVQADNVPAVRTEKAAAGKPEPREPALPVRTGVSAPAVKTEKITEKRTEVRERIVPLVLRAHQAGQQVQQILAGAGRAQGVKTPAVNSGAVSNVHNSTQKSTINNDNRRQEVNITVNGNADQRTVGQIKDGVTGVFAQGAASPVMG